MWCVLFHMISIYKPLLFPPVDIQHTQPTHPVSVRADFLRRPPIKPYLQNDESIRYTYTPGMYT